MILYIYIIICIIQRILLSLIGMISWWFHHYIPPDPTKKSPDDSWLGVRGSKTLPVPLGGTSVPWVPRGRPLSHWTDKNTPWTQKGSHGPMASKECVASMQFPCPNKPWYLDVFWFFFNSWKGLHGWWWMVRTTFSCKGPEGAKPKGFLFICTASTGFSCFLQMGRIYPNICGYVRLF